MPAAASDRVVVVQAGQTLSEIAAANGHDGRTGCVALNDIADPNRIYAGQRLRVRRASPSAAERAAPRAAGRCTASPTARTLTGIATRYGTTIRALRHPNHLANASRIYAGQLLRISGSPSPGAARTMPVAAIGGRAAGQAPLTSAPSSTSFARGENLSGIAIRYG